jgi:aminoglycoside phosphotransferase (APT) family kinase protein
MKKEHDLEAVAGRFRIHGDFLGAEPYGSGHINDTYAVRVNQGGTLVRYIIQRINHNVFKNIPALMENIERVTRHLAGKLAASGAGDVSRRSMTLIPTVEGGSHHRDGDGNSWRAYIFIEHAKTYDVLTSLDQAYQAARAFATFQGMLADLPDPPLNETIRDFHDGPKRYEAFLAVLDKDKHNRAARAKEEIDFLNHHAWIFDRLPELLAKGEIPVRSTHNDCKINNVMIDDETGEGVCVIDLDTLMPGLALYDFGDMVRTSTCPAAEDEQDLDRIVMDLPMFEKLVRGYLSAAGDFLTRAERDHLAFAGKMITLIIGTRFLTDYLAGDAYFKTHRKDHNLDRCRTQFKLLRSIAEQERAMQELVRRI